MIYKIKHIPHGSMEQYKAQLVTKSYNQQGLDYTKIFALVAKMAIFHTLLDIATIEGWYLHQLGRMQQLKYGIFISLDEWGDQCLQTQKKSYMVSNKHQENSDIILVGNNLEKIQTLKKYLGDNFKLKNLYILKSFLG